MYTDTHTYILKLTLLSIADNVKIPIRYRCAWLYSTQFMVFGHSVFLFMQFTKYPVRLDYHLHKCRCKTGEKQFSHKTKTITQIPKQKEKKQKQ